MVACFRVIRVLFCNVLLVCQLWRTQGENCPINPECTCGKTEGSSVRCGFKNTPYFPMFAAWGSRFGNILVDGSREIREIRKGSFDGVSATGLGIHNTGVTEIRCYEWSGLSGLTRLDLGENELLSIPRCSLKRLRTLFLDGNNLTALSSGAFRNFSLVKTLGLNHNHIAEISVDAFSGLSSPYDLDISSNNLTVIGSNAFFALTSLKKLDLKNNRITTLHTRAFDGLVNLETLFIGNNDLTAMDSTTFLALKKLTTLSVEYNNMLAISEDLLKGMKELKTFRINDNLIGALPKGVFKENQDLEYLDLSNNRLASIFPGTFSTTPKLRELLLSGNSLTYIQSALLWGLSNLYHLDLSSNQLTVLDGRLLVNCPNLRHIFLQGNNIYQLHADPFENATSLQTVDLSDNQLKTLPDEVLLAPTKLRTLRLSGNKITFLANVTILRHADTIRNIDLSGNGLTSASWPWLKGIARGLRLNAQVNLTSTYWSWLKGFVRGLRLHAQVNLTYNDFTDVPPYIYIPKSGGGNNSGVLLSHNKLQKMEIKEPLLRCKRRFGNKTLDTVYSYNLKSCSSLYFAHNELSAPVLVHSQRPTPDLYTVDLSFNILAKMEQFPVQVVPAVEQQDCPMFIVHRLNLSHNAISVVPAEACLGSVYVLDLRNNRIEVLGPLVPEQNTSRYHLLELYLSGNRIHRISSDAFTFFSGSMRTVDLAYNNLTEVEGLRAINTHGTSPRYSLRLFGNPIHCDCHTDWLKNGTLAPNVDSLRCHTPKTAKGFLVVCFDSLGCAERYEQTDHVLDRCKRDTYVGIWNVTAHALNSDTWPRVNVTWSRYGPGVITAFRMTTYSGSQQTGPPRLVAAEERNAVILYSPGGPDFSICISAVKESGDETEEICTNVNPDITISGVRPAQLETQWSECCVSKDLFLGLVTSLAVIVVIIAGGITVYFIRRCRSNRGQGRTDPSSPTKENVNMYSNPTVYENADGEKGQYETLS